MLATMLRAAANNETASNVIPTAGLVLNWTMSNISGSTLIDETGDFDGTIYGSTVIGDALQFDGVDDYVTVDPFDEDVYAMSIWVYFDSSITSASSREVIASFDDGSNDFQANISTGSGTVYATNETLTIGDGNSGNYGRTYIRDTLSAGWNHVLVNWNGSSYDVYVNNSKKTTYAGSNIGHCRLFSGYNDVVTLFRNNSSGGNGYLAGKAKLFKIYTQALSALDITALYDEGV
jgi:hypothetical protein